MGIKNFTIESLFPTLVRGKVHSQDSLPVGDGYFYVGAKKKENGVMCKCGYDESLISPGNCIIFICNGEGSVGYSLYMDRPFYASGDLVLGYNDSLNPYIAMYLVTLLDCERPKYSFGRKYGPHVKDTTLPLPATDNGEPDWAAIESIVKTKYLNDLPRASKSVWKKRYRRASLLNEHSQLDIASWKAFLVGDLFEDYNTGNSSSQEGNSEPIMQPGIYKATSYNASDLYLSTQDDEESIRYITRTDFYNGCKNYVRKDYTFDIEPGNAITIGDTTATVYYQEDSFICGDHMVVLRAPFLNKYTALFLITLLKKESYRYNYGRAFLMANIKNTKLLLPSTASGEPDWLFIENYIKGLSYSRNL